MAVNFDGIFPVEDDTELYQPRSTHGRVESFEKQV